MQYENEELNEEKQEESKERIGDSLNDELKKHFKEKFNNGQNNSASNDSVSKDNANTGNGTSADGNNTLNDTNTWQGNELHNGTNPTDYNTVASSSGKIMEGGEAAEAATAGATGAEAVTAAGASGAAEATAAGAGAAAEGGSAAAGATGVGIPIAIVMEVLKAGKAAHDEVASVGKKGSFEEDYQLKKGSGLFVGLLVCILFLYVIITGTYIQLVMPGTVESYRESQYNPESSISAKFLKNGIDTVKNIIPGYQGLEEYNKALPVEDAVLVYKEIIDDTITDTFRDFCEETIKKYDKNIIIKFFTGDDITRDDEKTKEEFLKQPYPYCKKTSSGYYTIGDFLDGKIPSYEENPQSYLNDDINYAEMLAILSMNEKFNIMSEDCTIEDFAKLLSGEKAKKYFYEMKMYPVIVEKEIEEEETVEEEVPEEEAKDKKKDKENSGKKKTITKIIKKIRIEREYYYTFEIKPFGLRELFLLAEVDMFEPDIDFTNQTNYDMLERKEKLLRTYARESEYLLGPSYSEARSSASIIYGESSTQTLTGRSAYYYIEDADNLGEEVTKDEWEEWDKEVKPDVTPNYNYSDTAKILSMPEYINQGSCSAANEKRGGGKYTIKEAGCIDCAYVMLAEYYTNKKISVKSVANNKNMYIENGFNTPYFMKMYGLAFYSANTTFDVNKCREYIDKNMPLVLHIKGYWEYNGVVYHRTTNEHFLLIMGYDQNGFYVYDPGSNNNTKNGPIPYEAFSHVGGKFIRDPYLPGFE